MKDKTKKTWIKIGSIAWKIGLVTVLNTGSIFAVVSYNFIDNVETTIYDKKNKENLIVNGKEIKLEVTYWEALTNKMYNTHYKPYNVWLIWLSVIAGAGFSLWFLYLVYKSKTDKDKEDREDERVDKQLKLEEKKNEKFLDTISKIVEGKK